MAVFKTFSSAMLPNFSPVLPADLSFSDGEYFLFPGFCDVHVHFREPGFS